jgi:hypothetical protein
VIYLTFDTDHLTDERMSAFLARFMIPGDATFFCTQRFLALEKEQHSRHEIGLHPFLESSIDWIDTLRQLRENWPSSVQIDGIRSHSCVFSQRFGVNLHAHGYKYVSHMTPPPGTIISPFRYPWGIIEVPICYMDNMDLAYPNILRSHTPLNEAFLVEAISSDLPFVFDFHPLHILLNTTSPRAYAEWWAMGCPDDYTCEGVGVRSYFEKLTSMLNQTNSRCRSLRSLVNQVV